jgi:DNA primase large subunit
MVLTRSDWAKYPFVSQASEHVRLLDIYRIENLEDDEKKFIIKRAEERVEEALKNDPPKVEYHQREDEIELLSFPVAVMFVTASNNDYLKRRYALAEGRRAADLLQKEKDKQKILDITSAFKWRIELNQKTIDNRVFEYALFFTDFLRNVGNFHEKEWKLVNRVMLGGKVLLTKHDVARLLQEEIRKYIERKFETDIRDKIPESIIARIDKLVADYSSSLEEDQIKFPEEVIDEAFPPCVFELFEAAKSGSHISHMGRFTLASFLLRIGMDSNDILILFSSMSDFNELLTRYQINHIAGSRGSRTGYLPPGCDALRTHGICKGISKSCKGIKNPIGRYLRNIGKKKLKNFQLKRD